MNNSVDATILKNAVIIEYGVQHDQCRLVEVDTLVDYDELYRIKGYLTFASYDPIFDNMGFAVAVNNMVRDGFDNRIMATIPMPAGIQIRRRAYMNEHEKETYGKDVEALIVIQFTGTRLDEYATWLQTDGVYIKDLTNSKYREGN